MFGLSKRKSHPIQTLVYQAFSNDGFLTESKEKGRDEFVISLLSLMTAFQSISGWHGDKGLKKYARRTNPDIVALDMSVFAVCQSIYEIEHQDFDGDESEDDFYEYLDEEFDPEAVEYYDDLRTSLRCTQAFFERDYDDCEPYFRRRIAQYSTAPKDSAEVLSLNLTSIMGASDLVGLGESVQLDLKLQMRMIAVALSFRKAMVPAFVESVENYVNMSV